MAWVVDLDKRLAGVAIKRGCHTYMVIGKFDRKRDALREPGKDAFNLLSPMTYEDAVRLNELTREWWPDLDYHTSEVCQCHACRERRDRDTEMKSEFVKTKSKIVELVKRYFRKG